MKGYSEDRQFYYKRLVEKYLDPKKKSCIHLQISFKQPKKQQVQIPAHE